MKDYYKILGVPKDCSQQDIKKAYRKLARSWHPDTCKNGDSSRFREVQEAYEHIGDKQKRAAYDRQLRSSQQQIYSNRNGFQQAGSFTSPLNHFDDSVSQFFGDRFFSTAPGNFSRHLELILSQQEAAVGGKISITIPVYKTCPVCHGSGTNLFSVCRYCQGAQYVVTNQIIDLEIPPHIANNSQYQVYVEDFGVLNITVVIR